LLYAGLLLWTWISIGTVGERGRIVRGKMDYKWDVESLENIVQSVGARDSNREYRLGSSRHGVSEAVNEVISCSQEIT
jgi:hypothetical protein